MIVDFHCHSTASDGTCTPSEIAAKAKDFVAIALTDHDNCDGIEEFVGVGGEGAAETGGTRLSRPQPNAGGTRLSRPQPSRSQHDGVGGEGAAETGGTRLSRPHPNAGGTRLSRPQPWTRLSQSRQIRTNGPLSDALGTSASTCDGTLCRRIPGIELSIEPGTGFDKFHLLGLGVDPANAELRTFLRRVLEGRNARNARISANFRRLGIEMSDIDSYAHGEVLARPHYAKWLMNHGYVASIAEAFDRYLLPESPDETRCYEERWHPSQEEAFRVIHSAGGLCVMAHPKYWRRTWKTEGCDFAAAERGLAELKEKGLDGVEALYQANTGEENVEFTRIATKLGYLKSAGSDFHGRHKPTIPLGMEVSEAFIAPLLERLLSNRF